ncbi:MAG: ZIP family metal transporter [Anaerolineales bacterium]|nr:ZIP family metal transporter [Anaerolineales bacterium]
MGTTFADTMIAASATVLANGVGALPFVFLADVPKSWTRVGWSLAGGFMLSASVFNLIIPGVNSGGILPVAAGIFLGAMMMVLTSRQLIVKERNFQGLSTEGSKRVLLVFLTMFIHSFPEGIALGVAFGSGEIGLGLIMAVAILIHNIPEGTAVAMPLRAEGVSGWKCVGWATLSGFPQILAAAPAYLAVVAFSAILPFAFGFAAGAMMFLVLSEMIPTSRAEEGQRITSAIAGTVGFLVMMILQVVLVNLIGVNVEI